MPQCSPYLRTWRLRVHRLRHDRRIAFFVSVLTVPTVLTVLTVLPVLPGFAPAAAATPGSATTGSATPGSATPGSATTGSGSGFVTRSGSQLMLGGTRFRFAGTNEYYLGLDDNIRDSSGRPSYPTNARIDNALQAAVRTGATVVRSHTLGISVGCSVCFEPRSGKFSGAALRSADYAVYRAGQLGLKLIIPLTDQWRYYHGGESVFTGWAGYPNSADPAATAANNATQRSAESHFYSDPAVISAFRAYVAHLVDHVNYYTKVAYKDDPAIMAWETGNELWTADPTWTQALASFLKHTLGVQQLVADGSAADGMSVANAAVHGADVDILGGHFYPVDVDTMNSQAAIAAANGKAYVIGEFDWTNATATAALLSAVEGNPNVSGDLYWTMMPYLENGAPEPHDDGLALYSPAISSSSETISALLTAHARRMSGQS